MTEKTVYTLQTMTDATEESLSFNQVLPSLCSTSRLLVINVWAITLKENWPHIFLLQETQ